jgi:hypothetical protein
LSEQVTVSQLLDAREALERILTLQLHPQTNHRIARITKFLDEEKAFFIAVRDPLVRKYGEADVADPTNFQIMPGMAGWAKYAEQVQTVMTEKVLFPFAKLNMSDLPVISPKEYMALEFMLVGPEDLAADEEEQLAHRAGVRAAQRAAMKVAADLEAEAPPAVVEPAPAKKLKIVKKPVAESPPAND